MTEAETAGTMTGEERAGQLMDLAIARIHLGANIRSRQPAGLKGLEASVRSLGVLEPVIVTWSKSDGVPTLVAGFRRVAAAKAAGLKVVPAIVQNLTAEEVMEVQLTENLQREDLSELDEARGFKAYLDTTGKTQLELAAKLGKSAPFISNRLRLLGLPADIQKQVENRTLPASHAEILAGAPPAIVRNLARKAIARGMNVRELEEEARWKAQRYRAAEQERDLWKAKVAKSKFPTCPVETAQGPCGRAAARENTMLPGAMANCGRPNHDWSLSTGKVYEAPKERERAAPARPTLPEVAEEVPFDASPDDVWNEVTKSIVITEFHVLTNGGLDSEVRIYGHRKLPPGLPGFRMVARGKRAVVQMDGCDSWSQQTDRDRKQLMERRTALQEWGAKLAKTPTTKAVAPRGKTASARPSNKAAREGR